MSKLAAYLILFGVSEFLVLMLIAEVLYPNYSVSRNFISDLGVGRTAIIFNSGIIVMGLLLMIGSTIIMKRVKPVFAFHTVFLTGLFSMLVGIFPETTGVPHLLSAFMAFFFGGVSAILTSFHDKIYLWTGLGVIALTALALFIGKFYEGLGPGGMERLILYPELIWGISFGTWLMKK